MLVIVIASLFLLAGFYLYRKYNKLKKPAPPSIPKERFEVPDTNDFRIAVHEAGHAITAWYCTAVSKMLEITMDAPDGGGYVRYEFYRSTFKENLWCDLVINLSGIAAEAIVYKQIRSGPSRKDLMRSREITDEIIKNGWKDPPWEIHGQTSLRFDQMFHDPLSAMEDQIIRYAFQYAKEFIWFRIKDHQRLVVLLLQNRTISRNGLSCYFGNREYSLLGSCFPASFIQS